MKTIKPDRYLRQIAYGLIKKDVNMQNSYTKIMKELFWTKLLFDKVLYDFKDQDDLKQHADIFIDSKTLWFYAGELFADFYNDHKIINVLSNALGNGANVQFVFGPALYVNNAEFLNMVFSHKNAKLYKRACRDKHHFKIIKRFDGKVLAIDDRPHSISVDAKDRNGTLIVHGYNDKIAKLISKFQEAKKKATLITRTNIMDEFANQTTNEEGDLCGFITRVGNKAVFADKKQIDKLARELTANSRVCDRKYSGLCQAAS